MDDSLSKDARGLVDGVMMYLKRSGSSKTAVPRVSLFLQKVTAKTRKEKLAHVETSVELTISEKQSIEQTLTKILGHDVTVEVTVKPELLGGLRISVGDWIVDTSLEMHLRQLSQSLL
jgi:F-type H+-transporting ATPase subunit delta